MTSSKQTRPITPPSSRTQFSRTMFHGSINFEQQKKRAKDLLKAIINGENAAQLRFSNHYPKALDFTSDTQRLKLSECQFVIARENGFSSWPQLKTHCDRLSLHKRQIGENTIPQLDDNKTLHIRCGSDIKHGLDIAGFVGDFHEFSDPFCQGPVPDIEDEEFYNQRADFIANAYGLPLKEVLAKQYCAYKKLNHLSDYTKVVLWFEHDSYDQLILACLLSKISSLYNRPTIELICVDEVPGVPDLTGLGQLAPEMFIWLWENRRAPISTAQFVLGKRVWNAIRQETPNDVQAIIAQGTQEIPPMAKALERHLQELPGQHNGLGLTQQLSLEIIADYGQIKGHKLFNVLMREREPLPFLGDLMFWSVLVELTKANKPLITYNKTTTPTPWPERQISLTD
ncbi:DUF1835 domain-containing protein [Kiloniella sp.]|uniref:DUF1835 domain-containing protein n=1 Tax=Kiloniella sp. TaxID=1938587 RepID=UPI003B022807